MDQQVKQWIDYAAQDLGVARHLLKTIIPSRSKSSATTASNPQRKQSKP